MKKLWEWILVVWAVAAAFNWWHGRVVSAVACLLTCCMIAVVFNVMQTKSDAMGEKGETAMKSARVWMLGVVLAAAVLVFFISSQIG